jgi:hypothetical protein
MPGPFAPSDDVVGPIAHAIAILIITQIPSIGTVYEKLPDRPPADNSVILPMTRGKVMDETNGKVKIRLTYSMNHLFRRTSLPDDMLRAYTYVMPWLRFLAAWTNQGLGGLAISVSATDLGITQRVESGQPYLALVVNFDVLTEFNIPLT